MPDPISNSANMREMGTTQNRPQSSPIPPAPGSVNPQTNLSPDNRVVALEAAVEKLIKRSLPANTKLQITQDKDTGTFIYRSVNPDTGEVVQQWPSEQIVKLRESLRDLEGLLLDTRV